METTFCTYCGKPIKFEWMGNGRSLPYDLDGERHYCEEYIASRRAKRKKRVEEAFETTDFFDISVGSRSQASVPASTKRTPSKSKRPHSESQGQPVETARQGQLPVNPTLKERRKKQIAGMQRLRNPAWTREEILLATEIYLRHEGIMRGPKDPDIIELSRILRALPIHTESTRNESFRNPSGVAMKLSNIRAVDPSAKAKGHVNGSVMDGVYWNELNGDRGLLNKALHAIRSRYPTAFSDHLRHPVKPIEKKSIPIRIEKPSSPAITDEKAIREVVLPNSLWLRALTDLQEADWFRSIRLDDARFKWFVDDFRAYARLSARMLYQFLGKIASSPNITNSRNLEIHKKICHLRDYAITLRDMTLEDELFSILASLPVENVPEVLADLQWDGSNRAASSPLSAETKRAIIGLRKRRTWTPALNDAIAVLLANRVEEPDEVGPTLHIAGLAESPEFSATGLSRACDAFSRQPPFALHKLRDPQKQ